jgi:hypothetical protein
VSDGGTAAHEERGFVAALVGDGRPLLAVSALALVAFGAFAMFLAATGRFLPHDVEYLGMTGRELCALHGCRIVHFMIHDRLTFGGVLVAIGTLYLWLVEFPLKRGEAWAWWTLAASGAAGFLSFLAYLGYGYLDTWHGAGTLGLLPLFAFGLARTRGLRRARLTRPPFDFATRRGRGHALLAASAFGIVAAGLTIMAVGATTVFVPQDLEFIRASRDDLKAVNERLVPLIAHDRAGFGGALFSFGIAMLASLLFHPIGRSLWQALALAGFFGFATAIGVHPAIGYTSFSHLAPAVAGALVYIAGLALAWPAAAERPLRPATA